MSARWQPAERRRGREVRRSHQSRSAGPTRPGGTWPRWRYASSCARCRRPPGAASHCPTAGEIGSSQVRGRVSRHAGCQASGQAATDLVGASDPGRVEQRDGVEVRSDRHRPSDRDGVERVVGRAEKGRHGWKLRKRWLGLEVRGGVGGRARRQEISSKLVVSRRKAHHRGRSVAPSWCGGRRQGGSCTHPDSMTFEKAFATRGGGGNSPGRHRPHELGRRRGYLTSSACLSLESPRPSEQRRKRNECLIKKRIMVERGGEE